MRITDYIYKLLNTNYRDILNNNFVTKNVSGIIANTVDIFNLSVSNYKINIK